MAEYTAIDLPGKILYKKPFSVSIRKITPIEQKYIISLTQKEQDSSKDYLNFIKKLITFDNPEMTFEELFWFDLQYILYRIRFVTYAKYPIRLRFKCTNEDCGEEVKFALNMGDLAIYTPDDVEGLITEIELEKLGTTEIRNKTVGDDLVIDTFMDKHGMDKTDLQLRLLLLDLCIISNGKSLEEMYKLAEDDEITAADITAIEEWFTKAIWGVKEEIKIKCPKCGKEESRGYYLTLEDFFSAI